MAAIRREFKEERVGLPDGIKIGKTHIEAYLASISDEAGRIPVDLEAEAIHTDEAVEDSVLTSGTRSQGERVRAHGKRVSIGDLLTDGLVREGDQWRALNQGRSRLGPYREQRATRGERRGSRESEQSLSSRDRFTGQRVVLLALPRRQRRVAKNRCAPERVSPESRAGEPHAGPRREARHGGSPEENKRCRVHETDSFRSATSPSDRSASRGRSSAWKPSVFETRA